MFIILMLLLAIIGVLLAPPIGKKRSFAEGLNEQYVRTVLGSKLARGVGNALFRSLIFSAFPGASAMPTSPDFNSTSMETNLVEGEEEAGEPRFLFGLLDPLDPVHTFPPWILALGLVLFFYYLVLFPEVINDVRSNKFYPW